MAHPYKEGESRLVAVIGDEDTVSGFLLAGVGDTSKDRNFLIVNQNTPHAQIEAAFKKMVARDDLAIIIINQVIANDIRYLIATHTKIVPVILEIPSKDQPYDVSKSVILILSTPPPPPFIRVSIGPGLINVADPATSLSCANGPPFRPLTPLLHHSPTAPPHLAPPTPQSAPAASHTVRYPPGPLPAAAATWYRICCTLPACSLLSLSSSLAKLAPNSQLSAVYWSSFHDRDEVLLRCQRSAGL